MKVLLQIITFFLALAGFVIGIQLLFMGNMIVEDPSNWDGGRGFDAVVHHLILLYLGGALILLISFLGLFGSFFGGSRRKGAWWLLVAPGFLGILMALGAIISLIIWQPNWEKYILLIGAFLGGIPLLFWLLGQLFRWMNPRVKLDLG